MYEFKEKRKRQKCWDKTNYTSQGIYPGGGLMSTSEVNTLKNNYNFSTYKIRLKLKLNKKYQIETLSGSWTPVNQSKTGEMNHEEPISIFISSLTFNVHNQRMELNILRCSEQKSSEIIDFRERKLEETIFKFYLFKDSVDVINIFWRGLTSNQEPFLVRGRVFTLDNCSFPFKPEDTFHVFADKAVYLTV